MLNCPSRLILCAALCGAAASAQAQECVKPSLLAPAQLAGGLTAMAKLCDNVPDAQVAEGRTKIIRSIKGTCVTDSDVGAAFDQKYNETLARAQTAPPAELAKTCAKLKAMPKQGDSV